MRRNDVTSTSFRRHVPSRFLINQCQIITFLILKSDIIENSRIELKEIVFQNLQIKLKLHLLLFYPSTWYSCDFFLFHIEIEGKGGWIIGGGAKVYFASPSQIIRGGGLTPPGRLCLHMEPRRMKERKVCLNDCGDMTKMVVTLLKLTKTSQIVLKRN